ncbi:hypothetical protein CERZMDRAFT_104774 [Cercospora zeae-maydis SCOH1-5]|uniref:Calcineurin-like phosphoesterase domain-containing protein n=1 Tax=Cercospora zeae-maydis SCOH1-5 TaxID=717836 RepID=A0A6A6FSQ7_9PEZI|nr:hypothetical protein CERZMDRAFT_104774 [Cercospora zeae-maydis SCOH1-5]
MSSPRVIKFLILSDTHDFDPETADLCPLKKALPGVDVVLHCGELTSVGGTRSYQKALEVLRQLDTELKLVIAGNHGIDLDGKFWRTNKPEGREESEHQADDVDSCYDTWAASRSAGFCRGAGRQEAGVRDSAQGSTEGEAVDAIALAIFTAGKARLAKGESTLMVNTAIMDDDYRPKNAPWVIELSL